MAKDRDKKPKPHISVSSIGNFLCCRRKCYWHLIRRLTLKYGRLSLEMGGIWDAAMNVYYHKKDLQFALTAANKEMQKLVTVGGSAIESTTGVEIVAATIKGMLHGYHEKYHAKDFKTWKIIKMQHEFCIKDLFGSGVDFTGFIDGIIEIKSGPLKGIWILENKTTKDLAYYSVETVKANNQTRGYIWAARKDLGIKARGIIWNAIRKPSKRLKQGQTTEQYSKELVEDYKARPDFYFFREQLIINSDAIKQWEDEMTCLMRDYHSCLVNGPKNVSVWYRNTQLCDMYGGCEFTALCNRGEKRTTLALYKEIVKE